MTPEQISLVQTSWQKVVPIKDKAAELFYGKLFEMDSSLKPMFKGDLTEQGRKLTAMINTVVNKLDNLAEIVPAVQDLGRRHAGYGVKDDHYATVAGALLWTLGAGLGDAFTPEVKAAWTEAYGILAGAMTEAATAAAA
jgi:hemoglobin-like flavoprotein